LRPLDICVLRLRWYAGAPHGALDRSKWRAIADSEQISDDAQHYASYAIDGDPSTHWHSEYDVDPEPQLPHQLDLFFDGAEHTVSGIVMFPRVDGQNGQIGEYEVYVSEDGETFSEDAVAAGNWDNSHSEKV
jgi:hypothetical protein